MIEFQEDRWARLAGVMLNGTFLRTKYALPHMMRRHWGRVINISSAHGLVASPFKSAYVSAKHGIVAFTKVAGWEVAQQGVTTNAICPGDVRMPLVERQLGDPTRIFGALESDVVGKIMLEAQAVKRMAGASGGGVAGRLPLPGRRPGHHRRCAADRRWMDSEIAAPFAGRARRGGQMTRGRPPAAPSNGRA